MKYEFFNDDNENRLNVRLKENAQMERDAYIVNLIVAQQVFLSLFLLSRNIQTSNLYS